MCPPIIPLLHYFTRNYTTNFTNYSLGCFGIKTLQEAQRTQAIESKTWIISAVKRMQNPFSALLAYLHSLVTIFPTLCTSLSSYPSTNISMTPITSPMAQQHTYCRHNDRKHQLQYSMHLLHSPHVNLLLHYHLNDNHQPQIAILASPASIELVSSSARVKSAKF